MIIKQNLGYEVAVRRFDNGENIVILPGEEVDVDEETANYLANLKCSTNNGDLVDFDIV